MKSSNLPLIAVAVAAIGFNAFKLAKEKKLRANLPALAILFLTAAVPIGCWMAWSRYAFGDFTGADVKIAFLGWTQKPFADWWQHPIFSWRGFWTFWMELMASFWRGEFVWHGQRIASTLLDAFYWAASPLLLAAAIAWAVFRQIRRRATTPGALAGVLELRGGRGVSRADLDLCRFRQLLLSVAGVSVFHVRPADDRRAGAVRAAVRLRTLTARSVS